MKILRVAQHLYPDSKGGGQYHVHAMSRDQAAMGHDVTVLTTRTDDSLPQTEETDGYRVIRVSPGVNVAGNNVSPAVASYLWGIERDEFDVIHAHSHLYFSTNLAALKRRTGEVPLAITNHGLYSQSAPEHVFRWYLKTLGRWTFNQADVVFCYTDVDKHRLRELGVRSRIEVVPNGIDTERFTAEGPVSEMIDADGPVVLFVGRLVEGKRPSLAVEAFDSVLDEYPDAELYLCGDGPLRENLVRQIENLGISPSVTFLGHVPYEDMPKVYRSGDVLVLPSRAEGVPRTVLEAMASGTRVVISNLEQVNSVFEGGIKTVPSSDAAAFSREITNELGNQPKRTPSSESNSTEFHWRRTVESTTTILERIQR